VTIPRLKALYAAQGIAWGLLMPFPIPLLVDRGLGAAEIGLVLSLSGLAALLAYPAWGAIADGWLGRRSTIAIAATTAAGGGILILVAGSDPVMLTLALMVAMVGALAWGPLIDALTLGELGDSSSSYGRIRVWASAGWAGSAVAGGALWVLAGPVPVFLAFSFGSVLVAVTVLWPARGAAASGVSVRVRADADEPERARPSLRTWLPIFLTPVMAGFLLGLLITSIGEHASWRFISLRILDQGGGVFLIGLAAALPAIVEIPVFASSRRLTGRWSLRSIFVIGALIATVLVGLIAVAPEPWMVTGLRTLEGASYALRYMAMVMIIGVLLPRHLYAMGQSVAWLVYAGVAPIIGDAAGGVVYDVYGAPVLFVMAASTFLIGGAIVYVALRGPEFARREARSDADEALPAPPPTA